MKKMKKYWSKTNEGFAVYIPLLGNIHVFDFLTVPRNKNSRKMKIQKISHFKMK